MFDFNNQKIIQLDEKQDSIQLGSKINKLKSENSSIK